MTTDRNHVDYLRSLVRMDRRKKERQIRNIKVIPGQPEEERDEIRKALLRKHQFATQTLVWLEDARRQSDHDPS